MKFAICRINTITGELRYCSKHSRWCKSLSSSLLFDDSYFAEDYFHFFVSVSAPGPFYYVVRPVRSVSSVGGC